MSLLVLIVSLIGFNYLSKFGILIIKCGDDGCHAINSETAIIEVQPEEKVGQILLSDEVVVNEQYTKNGQTVKVLKHRFFGHILMLGGTVQVVEKDEAAYHEMMTHTAFGHLPTADNILIVGGGDGGALLRVTEHPIQSVDIVDIDLFSVWTVSKKYFPEFAKGFHDDRTNLYESCAAKFIENRDSKAKNYDIIFVDATDCAGSMQQPTGSVSQETLANCGGVSGPLFKTQFYRDLKSHMSPGGILVRNLDSPSWDPDTISAIATQLRLLFKTVVICHFHVPTFLSGHYAVAIASDNLQPIDESAWVAKNIATSYYTTAVHKACYALPKSLEDVLGKQ